MSTHASALIDPLARIDGETTPAYLQRLTDEKAARKQVHQLAEFHYNEAIRASDQARIHDMLRIAAEGTSSDAVALMVMLELIGMRATWNIWILLADGTMIAYDDDTSKDDDEHFIRYQQLSGELTDYFKAHIEAGDRGDWPDDLMDDRAPIENAEAPDPGRNSILGYLAIPGRLETAEA